MLYPAELRDRAGLSSTFGDAVHAPRARHVAGGNSAHSCSAHLPKPRSLLAPGNSRPAQTVFQRTAEEDPMDNSKPVDHPPQETVNVRQGTGPRATVSVLLISTVL